MVTPFLVIGFINSQTPVELLFGQTVVAMLLSQFVIDSIAILISVGFIYWLLSLTNKKISWGLTLSHILLTVSPLLLIALFPSSDAWLGMDQFFDFIKRLFILGQILFGVNIIWTLLSRLVNK